MVQLIAPVRVIPVLPVESLDQHRGQGDRTAVLAHGGGAGP